jgi:hypothetical protein
VPRMSVSRAACLARLAASTFPNISTVVRTPSRARGLLAYRIAGDSALGKQARKAACSR